MRLGGERHVLPGSGLDPGISAATGSADVPDVESADRAELRLRPGHDSLGHGDSGIGLFIGDRLPISGVAGLGRILAQFDRVIDVHGHVDRTLQLEKVEEGFHGVGESGRGRSLIEDPAFSQGRRVEETDGVAVAGGLLGRRHDHVDRDT